MLAAVALPPEIDGPEAGLMSPQAEEPRVIAEKDIPEEEKVSTRRLLKRPPGARDILLEAHPVPLLRDKTRPRISGNLLTSEGEQSPGMK